MRRIFLPVVLCLACLATPLASAADRIVVGISKFPSVSDLSPSEQAVAFPVDVVREAARREGLEISWREITGGAGADAALADKSIDVYPVAFDTPQRRERFYLTEPWWFEDLSFLVRLGGSHRMDSLAGKRVTLASHLGEQTIRQEFPAARIDVPEPAGFWNAAVPVCKGDAEAALMPDRWIVSVLADRPPECAGLKLELVATPAKIGVSLMTTKERAGLAIRLRRAIDRLAEDGTLTRIAQQHPGIPSSSAVVLAEQARRQGEQRVLWIVIFASALTLGTASFLIWRMHRYQGALEANEKELRASNADLQAYAYMVSHDLQEPLRMVSAYTGMLERHLGGSLDDRGREMMATVREGALRMSTMLRDLLQFNQAGRDIEAAAGVSAQAAAERAVVALRQPIEESGAEIEIRPLPRVVGSEERIAQVFQNLVGNALKYRRPEAVPRIVIDGETAGDTCRFSVTDNGIGIKTEYADRIFQVFERLHGPREYSGNGIGLAIAKRIVERHGGKIWLDWSEPGVGTRFAFTLPSAEASRTAAASGRISRVENRFQENAG